MAWQQYVADVALEYDPITGLPYYREIWLTVPRQSGKTTLILSLCIHRAIGFGSRQNIIYAAQTRNDARKKWEDDHLKALDATPFRRMYRTRKTNGNEAIMWRNGSMHGITSTTEKAGHGGTLDLGVIDEAFAQEDDRLEQAFKPAMVTREAAQLLGLSTAGTMRKSKFLLSKVRAGRRFVDQNVREGVAYFEWSVPGGALDPDGSGDAWDPADPETWRACMPAMHLPDCPQGCTDHTISERVIAIDFKAMAESDDEAVGGISGFRRAYLNQWVDREAVEPVISRRAWTTSADPRSVPDGSIAMAIDTTPGRTRTAIGMWGRRTDGKTHVEIADEREGSTWVVPRVVEIYHRWRPLAVVIDPASAAGSFIDEIESNGVPVTKIQARELAHATGVLYDAIMADRLRHRDQASLNDAVAVAQKRKLSDAWTWDRQNSSDNIAPLVAVTLAGFGYTHGEGTYDVLSSVV